MERQPRIAAMPGTIMGIKPPLLGILRGVTPGEAVGVAEAAVAAGIRIIEVTMNSPDALESISAIAAKGWDGVLVGAGTVLTADEVARVADAGGKLVVSPNFDPSVVRRTKELGLVSAPGCMTPSEVFAALEAGADVIKLFPGEVIVPAAVRAMRAVVPRDAVLVVTGGVTLESIAAYRAAGADGMGLGSALYKPGKDPRQVRADGEAFVAAYGD